MDYIENHCFHLSMLPGMSNLRASKGNYYTVLIMRKVAPSSWPYVATQRVIWMTTYGVL